MDLQKAQLTRVFVGAFTQLTKFSQSRVQMSYFNTSLCIWDLPFTNPAGTETEQALNTNQGTVQRNLTPLFLQDRTLSHLAPCTAGSRHTSSLVTHPPQIGGVRLDGDEG